MKSRENSISAALFISGSISEPERNFMKLNFPGIDILDIEETCRSFHLRCFDESVFISDDVLLKINSAELIWYHPGSFNDFCVDLWSSSDVDDRFYLRQLEVVRDFIESLIDQSGRALDAPALQRTWNNKIFQNFFFKEIQFIKGVNFEITRIIPKYKDRLILKHISESRKYDSNSVIFARRIDDSIVSNFSDNRIPFILQPEILSNVEYRAYYFDDILHCFCADRSDLAGNIVDIHCVDDLPMRYISVDLDAEVEKTLNRLRRRIPLRFFALDFFILDGALVPLEVNPLASWAWLPAKKTASMTLSIQAMLTINQEVGNDKR